MITFYRRIRQKMITEKKLNKYLIYAIGEVVLVVIGILVAIQLNKWNENKKDRVLEKVYYCQLLENVIQDELQLNELMGSNVNRIRAGNELLGLLQKNNSELALIAKAQLKTVAGASQNLVLHNATFEDIKSSGNLKIITDELIKTNLSNYYSQLESMITSPQGNSEAMIKMYLTHKIAGVGVEHINLVTDYLDERYVDKSILLKNTTILEADRKYLTTEALIYLAINARYSQHIESMRKEVYDIKGQLKLKCENQV